jgi:hypothetical protein
MIKNYLQYAVASALFVASGMSIPAFAAEVEKEVNDTVDKAQALVVGASRSVDVSGAIGLVTLGGTPAADVDFYSFQGRAGDVVTVDVDGGMKPSGSSVRSLDSVLAVFGPDLALLRQIDDVPAGSVDAGSVNRFDARLDNVVLPTNGRYIVGVASSGRVFTPGGNISAFVARSTSNGSYTLIISGVSPSVQQISIDIKPGLDRITRVNPKAKGTIPVALLSAAGFDASKVDESSVRFGPTGTEASGRCNKQRADLLCHFDLEAAGFDEGDTEGVVTGMIGGMPFEGRGWLKVIPGGKN